MKKLLITTVLVCLFIPQTTFAQEEEKFSAFNIGIVPRASDAQYTNAFSFNLFVGLSKNEKAFTFASLANIIRNDANGLQFAGLTNIIGNNSQGLQFAGLYNQTGNNGKGLQFAGLANINKNSFQGLQFAGLLNTAKEVKGLQFAGLHNQSSTISGFQFAGLSNISSLETKGFQFAGITNISNNVSGFQFAGIGNIAQDVNGFQFGAIFNKAGNVKGSQFGLINIADHSDYPIGLVNIIKDGEKSIGITYDESGSTIVGLRTGGRILYGILGIGYNHKAKEEWVIQGGFGAHIPIVDHFRINCELTTQSMTDFKGDNKYVNKNSFAILPAFSFLPNFEIFAGPSINYTYTNDIENTKVFPKNDLWKKTTSKRREQLYIGYTAGIQYIF